VKVLFRQQSLLSHYGGVLENDYPLCTDSWFRDMKLLNSNQEPKVFHYDFVSVSLSLKPRW